jgi:Glucodextranase, domain B/PASTA domain
VTGTAASVDGQATVTVNGVWAIVGSDGQWSADVPLSEGSNQIVAVASNRIGVTTTASVSVNRPAAPAAPAAATGVVAAKPIRCVVPRLRGKTLTTAKRLLKRAHCRLGKVVHEASTRVKPGRIVATRFKAGTRHPAGSRVRVTVATKARRR